MVYLESQRTQCSVVQADLPAEAVPKLLGKEGEGWNHATGGFQESSSVSGHSSGSGKLKVCILTADFWGLKAAGGTATAYHLLAAALAKEENLQVSANFERKIKGLSSL